MKSPFRFIRLSFFSYILNDCIDRLKEVAQEGRMRESRIEKEKKEEERERERERKQVKRIDRDK